MTIREVAIISRDQFYFGLDPPRLPPLLEPPEPLGDAEAPTLCDEVATAEGPPKDPARDAEVKEEVPLWTGVPARSVTGPALAP
jgi:hypothetical protein